MTRSLLPALGLGLSLALVAGGTGPALAEDVPVPATTAGFTISGHGYGHGHGMSQYGAKGAATQGLSWRQIVGFYYPGTEVGRTRGTIKVLLTAATKKTLVVDARPGLRLDHVGTAKTYRLDRLRPRATQWRITPKGQKSVVTYRAQGARGWRKLVTFPGEAEVTAGSKPITLRLPHHAKADYRGALRSVDKQTVNVLPIDRYLQGVVPREVPAEWPAQAVRAQAVAARTYAAYERATATGSYDICDTESCQVYGGVEAEEPESDAAVRKTRGRVVTYQGEPAFTQFSSSDGGWTSAGSMPYLVAQADPYEAFSGNPNATWGPVTFTRQELEKEWPEVGTLTDLNFTRAGNGDFGGWVTSVTLTGSAGTTTVSGDDFRYSLGLRSAYLQVSTANARELVTRLLPWAHRTGA